MRLHINIKQLRTDIWESLAGTEMDFTSGSIGRAVFLLSVPMVLEMVLESIFAIVDIFFVARLGSQAVATVGITESMITIVYSIGSGLAVATTALVARRTGEKRPEEASKVAFQAILTSLLVSLVIAIPGFLWADDLLRLMGGSKQMQEQYVGYTRIMLGLNGIIILLFVINSVLRSSGDAAMSLRVLLIANLFNIVLDPMFIFGIGPFPELGVTGAAVATSTGRGIGILFQLYLLFRGKRRIRIRASDIRIEPRTMWQLFRLSLGGTGQSLIATTSWIGMMRIVSSFGSFVVAGYTIALRIVVFGLLPSWGISNAASTLVGQNLGANQPERAERSVWITARINVVLLGIIGLAYMVFPGTFIRMFIGDPDVIGPGIQALRTISTGFLFYGLGMVMIQAFNGAGDTVTPTRTYFICFWLIEVPMALLLSRFEALRQSGVFIAIVVAEVCMTLLSLYLFRKGTWKTKKI